MLNGTKLFSLSLSLSLSLHVAGKSAPISASTSTSALLLLLLLVLVLFFYLSFFFYFCIYSYFISFFYFFFFLDLAMLRSCFRLQLRASRYCGIFVTLSLLALTLRILNHQDLKCYILDITRSNPVREINPTEIRDFRIRTISRRIVLLHDTQCVPRACHLCVYVSLCSMPSLTTSIPDIFPPCPLPFCATGATARLAVLVIPD
jgi:hypothetical protein